MARASRGAANGQSAGVSVLDFEAFDERLERLERERLDDEGAGWMSVKEIALARGWSRNRAQWWAERLVAQGLAEFGQKRIRIQGSGTRAVPAYRLGKAGSG